MSALKKDERKRPLIRVQLADHPDAHHAAQIVSYWTSIRMGTFHLMRAIRMYYALLMGDATLLREYFPLLQLGAAVPAVAARIDDDDYTPGSVELHLVERDASEDLNDFLDSLGMG